MPRYKFKITVEREVEAEDLEDAINEAWFHIHHDSDPSNPPEDAVIEVRDMPDEEDRDDLSD